MIRLTVNEGDEFDLKFIDKLGSATGKLDGPKPMGYPITVKMAFDGDGILRATAHDGNTGALITQVEVQRKGAMSKRQEADTMAGGPWTT